MAKPVQRTTIQKTLTLSPLAAGALAALEDLGFGPSSSAIVERLLEAEVTGRVRDAWIAGARAVLRARDREAGEAAIVHEVRAALLEALSDAERYPEAAARASLPGYADPAGCSHKDAESPPPSTRAMPFPPGAGQILHGCGHPLAFEMLGGGRVWRDVDGLMAYRAKCNQCGFCGDVTADGKLLPGGAVERVAAAPDGTALTYAAAAGNKQAQSVQRQAGARHDAASKPEDIAAVVQRAQAKREGLR